MVNILKDIVFLDQTTWTITKEARNDKFGDFESVFPFPHPAIMEDLPQPIRRVKSWHLITAKV
jgi:hypothetical protein